MSQYIRVESFNLKHLDIGWAPAKKGYLRHFKKKTRSKEILGQGGQTLRVAGDFNPCLSVVAVPSTSDEWLEDLFSELIHRHNDRFPARIYLDKDCCGGIPGVKSTPSATWKKYLK